MNGTESQSDKARAMQMAAETAERDGRGLLNAAYPSPTERVQFYIEKAASQIRLTGKSSCQACGYWNDDSATYCLDCGTTKAQPVITISKPLVNNDARSLLTGIALTLLCLSAYYHPLITLPLFFVAGFIFFRLRRRRFDHSKTLVEVKARTRVTLRNEQSHFRQRLTEIDASRQEFASLLRDRSVTGTDREAATIGQSTLNVQFQSVSSRLKEIEFFRWQNQVEAAALVVGNLTAEFDGNFDSMKQEVFRLFEHGEKIAAFWRSKHSSKVFQRAALEYLPRIKTLREACLQMEKRLTRLKVLHAYKGISSGIEDAETGAGVLLDDQLAAETIETIIDLDETHINGRLRLEVLRMEGLAEVTDDDNRLLKPANSVSGKGEAA